MLVFEPGWNSGANNNAANALAETALGDSIKAAITKLKLRTNDTEFKHLVNSVESTSTMLKAKVVKGMHQETGNDILPEIHCTIEVPDWPAKRFHIWYLWAKMGKTTGWQSYKVSYESSYRVYQTVDIL